MTLGLGKRAFLLRSMHMHMVVCSTSTCETSFQSLAFCVVVVSQVVASVIFPCALTDWSQSYLSEQAMGSGVPPARNYLVAVPDGRHTSLVVMDGRHSGELQEPSHLAVVIFVSSYFSCTSDFVCIQGIYWQVGDIVSVMDEDGGIYYAQLRGFLQDQFCVKSAVITWLLPTTSSPAEGFHPATYILGQSHPATCCY